MGKLTDYMDRWRETTPVIQDEIEVEYIPLYTKYPDLKLRETIDPDIRLREPKRDCSESSELEALSTKVDALDLKLDILISMLGEC